MKLKAFSVSFDPAAAGLDDTELQVFQRGEEFLELRGHFFEREGSLHCALMIAHREGIDSVGESVGSLQRQQWLVACPIASPRPRP